MDKNDLRHYSSLLRRNLNQKEASDIIVSKIIKSEAFCGAKNILIFYPMKFEINLLELVKFKEKNFFLPRVSGDYLEICPYSENLIKSELKIMEPAGEKIENISIIDVAYIPALCVDLDMNRIGYGKGYYDRLFSDPNFKAEKIAVINKELVAKKIEADAFDKKIDSFITD